MDFFTKNCDESRGETPFGIAIMQWLYYLNQENKAGIKGPITEVIEYPFDISRSANRNAHRSP